MIRIGSDTDIGMNRNSSDWLGRNEFQSDTFARVDEKRSKINPTESETIQN